MERRPYTRFAEQGGKGLGQLPCPLRCQSPRCSAPGSEDTPGPGHVSSPGRDSHRSCRGLSFSLPPSPPYSFTHRPCRALQRRRLSHQTPPGRPWKRGPVGTTSCFPRGGGAKVAVDWLEAPASRRNATWRRHAVRWLPGGRSASGSLPSIDSGMASLVAYDDSDSEAETEPVGSVNDAGQMKDTSGIAKPLRQDFASGVLDVMKGGAQPTKPTSKALSNLQEDLGRHSLPVVRLGRSDRGSCPSQKLQWPKKEPEVTFPTRDPSRPSLWTTHAPAGHVPWPAAHLKEMKLSWEMYDSPQSSFCAQTKFETTGTTGSSVQKKRREDCVIPYIPKRLRQLQILNTDAGQSKEVGPQGLPAGCAPAPLCVTPRVSEFIQPFLDSQYKETIVPRSVLFHLRGHRGPVNSIQWCPVFSKSHMLLSVSMDKTFKVWNAVDTGACLQTYSLHKEAVRAARWSPCGRRILSGGFDFAVYLTDLETGTQLFSGQSDFRITTLKFHPKDHSLFLCGGFSSEIKAWDVRTGKVVRGYKATIQQTLDILFLQEGSEFLSSTDASSRDSADRTIIAWDFRSSAKISNQIFHERYTCPSLALHPREPVFLAQTNGNYLALFSAVWPYRMSRRRRYEGHKVEGYSVGCECSPDGDLLVTGSADGRTLQYSFRTARRACTLSGHTQACVGATFHPVLPSVLATCSWEGDAKIWH
ncbi:WD repeat-containing protein 25 isoform X2 [Tamandua tetradactyla]|uniref:WD repeat-containing protein 25 isoform X2 n=1 Tax=Tamandua tetradactyla TaxID=48850 RepID=UPI0040538DD7